MTRYFAKALQKFQHYKPTKPQHSPFQNTKIDYGAKKKYATQSSKAPLLDKKGKRFIQQVCGKLLFLSHVVDSTLLCPISTIAFQSATPIQDTIKKTTQLIDYISTQEEEIITYNASEMILAAHSDARYLSEPKAISRAGRHFFLTNHAEVPPKHGAVINIAHIIKKFMS